MAEAPAAEGKPRLYSYWRSSCSHRARIVLNLKGTCCSAIRQLPLWRSRFPSSFLGLDWEFMKLNPMKFVPALVDGDAVIGDSNAITMYLEDKYPEHPLLPQDLKQKALNIQIASIVCSGIQPLHNLTLLRFIEQKVGTGESLPWTQQQIDRGFTAVENLIKGYAGKYATGDEVQLYFHLLLYLACKRCPFSLETEVMK